MRILHINQSLNLIGCDLHGWKLSRRIGRNGNQLWVQFRYFPTLEAARAELGDIPKLNGGDVTEGLEGLLIDGFMPRGQHRVGGFMKAVNGWKDRKTFGSPHARGGWKPERLA